MDIAGPPIARPSAVTSDAPRSVGRHPGTGEEGQSTAEYVAVIVLVAGLVALVATNGQSIVETIGDVIEAAFERVERTVGG